MSAPDVNPTSLVAVAFAALVAAAIRWFERRKEKAEEDEPPRGDAQVVAASFVETKLMQQLIDQLVTLNAAVTKINDRLHEDDLVRAAVSRMRGDRP